MKKLIVSILIIVIATLGCEPPKKTVIERSEIMYEGGVVVDTLYNKGFHSRDVNIAVGMTMSGDIGFGVVPSEVRVPETWGVVFRCDHGDKFAIQGSDASYKSMWERLDKGDGVIIYYHELYKVEYKGDIKVQSSLVDYDFVRAEKKPSEG